MVPTTVPTSASGMTEGGDDVVEVDALPLDEWARRRVEQGRSFLDILPGLDTSARVVQSSEPETSEGDTGVLLDDLIVVPFPEPSLRTWSGIARIGDELVVVATDPQAGGVTLWWLDTAARAWRRGAEISESPRPFNVWTVVADAARLLIVGVDRSAGVGVEGWQGLAVSADDAVTPLTAPGDDVPFLFQTVAAGYGFLLGYEHAENQRTPTMWAYDLTADWWEMVPNPPWLACTADDSCDWSPELEADERVVGATSTQLVFEVADNDLAMLDPTTMTWTDLGPPPFDLRTHVSFVVDDETLVALPVSFEVQSSATYGVLDLTTDMWTTGELPDDQISLWWTAAVARDSALFGTGEFTTPATPTLAFDLTTHELRPPSEADQRRWLETVAGPSMPIDDLLAALGSAGSR